ncbi:MAG: hypothetical protein RsTaC01_0032 [Candidatus Paraimprobicoccus trichonymphae]|uniref:Uncharacterized protein n=1 Tax=Candidatus Paraimprobicoccus trichonymphae TaxID=3033793 RepID=A0AA48L177_9FIRM|nr:MAG: hypothetical protein RsTaC01_0032 [Candidatus Paraimprobicoccus trichonymphae]
MLLINRKRVNKIVAKVLCGSLLTSTPILEYIGFKNNFNCFAFFGKKTIHYKPPWEVKWPDTLKNKVEEIKNIGNNETITDWRIHFNIFSARQNHNDPDENYDRKLVLSSYIDITEMDNMDDNTADIGVIHKAIMEYFFKDELARSNIINWFGRVAFMDVIGRSFEEMAEIRSKIAINSFTVGIMPLALLSGFAINIAIIGLARKFAGKTFNSFVDFFEKGFIKIKKVFLYDRRKLGNNPILVFENLSKSLNLQIIGQGRAIESITRYISGNISLWNEGDHLKKSIVNCALIYLYGPSGNGKSSTIEALSWALFGHGVSPDNIFTPSLIDKNSNLTAADQVFYEGNRFGHQFLMNPDSVFIFDEIDKIDDPTLLEAARDARDSGTIKIRMLDGSYRVIRIPKSVIVFISNEASESLFKEGPASRLLIQRGEASNEEMAIQMMQYMPKEKVEMLIAEAYGDSSITFVPGRSKSLINRMHIVEFEKLSVESLNQILTKLVINFVIYMKFTYNIDLKYDENDLILASESIYKMNKGARGANDVIAEISGDFIKFILNDKIKYTNKLIEKHVSMQYKQENIKFEFDEIKESSVVNHDDFATIQDIINRLLDLTRTDVSLLNLNPNIAYNIFLRDTNRNDVTQSQLQQFRHLGELIEFFGINYQNFIGETQVTEEQESDLNLDVPLNA